MRLVVTRPEPDATRTGRALIALGHVAILSPMLDVTADPGVALPAGLFQAVLATSSNAVRALAARPDRARLEKLPLYAVGDRTALEARRAGFRTARSAGGALADLVALVASELSPHAGPLLYAAGDVQAGDLAGRLGALGFGVETAVLYRTAARPRLSGVASKALRGNEVDGVLLYSQRSAAAFALALRAEALAPLPDRVTCYAVSQAAVEPVRAVTRGRVAVAAQPDQISLFALLEDSSTMDSSAAADR